MPPNTISIYTQGHTPASQFRHSSRNAANTCTYFTTLLSTTKPISILDVGCGPGSISSSLARLVPQGHVTGIDSSETAISNARSQADLPENCTFQTGDAYHLDAFPDGTFDVVHTSQVLCHLTDPVAAVREFHRVLKTGGFIACREGDGGSRILYPPPESHPGLAEWARLSKLLSTATGREYNTGRYLLRWAVDAGFDVEKCQFTASTMTHAGQEAWPFAESVARQTVEDERFRESVIGVVGSGEPEEGERVLKAIAEGWRDWAKDECCVFSLICGEIVAYK